MRLPTPEILRTPTLALLCLLLAAAALAAPEARLERSRIHEGETVVLLLRVSGDSQGTPDLAPLATDFEILERSQNMQMRMINGRSFSSRGWQLVLMPRRSGTLTIPALSIGPAQTRPLTLEVLPAAQASQPGPAPPVLLEAEVDPQRPWVQQKVIYTVRLLARVALARPLISEPQVTDAIVEPLGPGTEYRSQRDGQTYRVVERRYALFPQKSGALSIDGPMLNAELVDPNPGGAAPGQRLPGRGGLSARGRPIRLRAAEQVLDVQPQPAGTSTPWLPAESVTLEQAWTPEPPVFRVGEPLTQRITITAQGLSPAQLPALSAPSSAAFKVYPDPPQSQVRVDGDTLVAQQWLSATVVPAAAGRVQFPEVSLRWWDVRSGTERTARLPAQQVEVLPATAAVSGAAVYSGSAPADAPAPAEATSAPAGRRADELADRRVWTWALVLLALAALALWRRPRRAPPAIASVPDRPAAVATPSGTAPSAGPPPGPPAQPAATLAQVEQACRADDARGARSALLGWAAGQWPDDPPGGLEALGRRLGGAAAQTLAVLDRTLYAGRPEPWDGDVAWTTLSPALAQLARQATRRRPDSPLPPLYPQGT